MTDTSPSVSGGQAPPDRSALDARTNDLEEAYEFFLAYAAQGLPQESGQVRDFLGKFDRALDGLGAFFTAYVTNLKLDAAAYQGFIDVIDRDARAARAAVRMVLAQPAITSQVIDNLNASIHVRALLTDLFLIEGFSRAPGRQCGAGLQPCEQRRNAKASAERQAASVAQGFSPASKPGARRASAERQAEVWRRASALLKL